MLFWDHTLTCQLEGFLFRVLTLRLTRQVSLHNPSCRIEEISLWVYLPSLACRSLNRRLEFELRPSISCTDEARLLLHTLSLEMDCARQVVDWAWDRLGRSHSCLGDEWSRGPDTLIGDEWGLELMSACVSLASAGLLVSLVGDWNFLKGTESLLALGESTITVSGSSWGRDSLLEPNRFKEGRRNLKNLPFPGGDKEKYKKIYKELRWSLTTAMESRFPHRYGTVGKCFSLGHSISS